MRLIFIFFTAVAVLLCSCDNYLNVEPTDFLTEDKYYDTEQKLNVALSGVYQPLAHNRVYGNAIYGEFGASTDEAHNRWSYATTGVMVNDFDNGSQIVNEFWKQCYTGIERSNILIENINLPKMSDAGRNVILGEALFLRAYYHFLLTSYYGDVPLKISRTTDPQNLQNSRTPAVEVYNQIISDMTKAIPLVKTSSEWGFAGRISKTAIKGILARVCLTRAGAAFRDKGDSQFYFKEALKWSKEVVDSGEHMLVESYDNGKTNSAYSQVFINAHENKYDVRESMWEIEFSGDGVDGKGNLGNLGNVIGITLQNNNSQIIDAYGYNYASINANPWLFNLYQAGDLRRDWAIASYNYAVPTEAPIIPLAYRYIDYLTEDNGSRNTGRCVGKWRREYETVTTRKINSSTPINFPVLRYSDVLLMLAEAENEVNGGPTETAYQAINQVRRRGFGVPTKGTAQPIKAIKTVSLSAYGYGSGRGYVKGINILPVTVISKTGTGALLRASADPATGIISGVHVENPGKGYTPGEVTLEFPAPWPVNTPEWKPGTAYKANDYVKSGSNYYKVVKAGTSTSVAPMNAAPSSYPATSAVSLSKAEETGAVFEWAQRATAKAVTVEESVVDLQGLSKVQFWEEVKNERTRELCFEALRKQDLIRWGDFLTTMAKTANSFRAINHFGHLAFTNVASRHLLLPIPSAEISVNKAIKQNPGW